MHNNKKFIYLLYIAISILISAIIIILLFIVHPMQKEQAINNQQRVNLIINKEHNKQHDSNI